MRLYRNAFIIAYNTICYMRKGYREGSRMSKALDYLVREGVDCVKIANSKHPKDKAKYLAIKIDDDKDFIDDLKNCEGGRIITEENMEICTSLLLGSWIMRLNPKLKLENDKMYRIIEIGYL